VFGDGSGNADEDEVGLLDGGGVRGAEKLASIAAVDAIDLLGDYVKADGLQVAGESFCKRLAHIAQANNAYRLIL